MMELHLIRKDILLAKRFVLLSVLIAILIPPVFALATSSAGPPPVSIGLLSFLYMVVFTEILLLQSISGMEAKSPKASALLCAAPYTRKAPIRAKYSFFILHFIFCYVVHTVLSLVVSPSGALDLISVLIVLLCSTIVYSVFLPVEFRYGNVKAQYVFLVVILIFGSGPMIFTEFLSNIDFSFIVARLAAMSGAAKCIFLALLSICLFTVSITISTKIFSKKEL